MPMPRLPPVLSRLRRRALLEAVKQLKLQELEAAGVPKKYHAQVGAQVDAHKRHAEEH